MRRPTRICVCRLAIISKSCAATWRGCIRFASIGNGGWSSDGTADEFMQPLGLTQGALAEAMGVQRKHVNELCNNRRNVTAATALILARVFGNGPDFWLNVQRRSDLWEVMHSPRERERIERARPLTSAA